MSTLALCMIARNEEAFLPDCLASVADVIDEIVVVDTGSTDATMAIAKKAGARVLQEEWRDDFAAARNTALAAVESDWVLLLDADERLAVGGAALRSAIERPDLDCGLLELHNATSLEAVPEDIVGGRARSGEPILLPRLLRRTPDLAWRGCVHEDVDHWLEKRVDRVAPLRVDLVHYGALPAIRQSRAKSDRNIRLLRQRLAVEPQKVNLWVHLSNELMDAGDPEDARVAAENAWDAVTGGLDETESNLLGRLIPAFTLRAQLHWHYGEVEELARTVAAALELYPQNTGQHLHPNILFYKGLSAECRAPMISNRRARWQLLAEAAGCYQTLLQLESSRWTAYVVPGVTGKRSAARLAQVLTQLGHYERATQMFAELDHAETPDRQNVLLGLAEAHIGGGRPQEALDVLQRVGAGQATDSVALRACARLALAQWDEVAACGDSALERSGAWRSPHRAFLLEGAQRAVTATGEPVFLGGAGRSGANLLRAILHAHRGFHCPPELMIMPELLSTRERWQTAYSAPLATAGLDSGALDNAFRAFTNAALEAMCPIGKRLAEWTPHNALHFAALVTMQPRARCLHIVRDGRAVVASLLRQPLRDPATGEPSAFCASAGAAAAYWAEVVQCARQDSADILGSVLEIRFEELVQSPETVMRRVFAFLGADWDPSVLDSAELRAIEVDEQEQWRRELTPVQVAQITEEAGYLLEDLGYLTLTGAS